MPRMTPVERIGAALSAWRGERREATLASLLAAERQLYGSRSTGGVTVTESTALRHSAVWAALRLRANLVSSLPLDCYISLPDGRVEEPRPQVLVEPWPGTSEREWRYGSQYDLDRAGNTFGIVHARDREGRPTVVEPVGIDEVRVTCRGRRVTELRVNGESIPLDAVWHEKQYAPAGFALGMSPIQAARWSIGGYLAAQDYSLDWFAEDGAHPVGVLKNLDRTLNPETAAEMKRRFKAAVRNRDIFVTGRDWEWTAEAVEADSAGFLEAMRWGAQDVARFLDVPADMIDAGMSGSSITYANITQRNLQFLITALQPALTRREEALSRLCPTGVYVRFNSDALLRMDPATRWKLHADRVRAGLQSVNEVRAIEDMPGIGPDGDRFLWPPFRSQLDAVEYEGGSNVAGPPVTTWEVPT